ncbi:MAG: hypothetical protein RIR18_2388 [Pseudomonadota bacterium]|jgi:non-heme chloroperoxidase
MTIQHLLHEGLEVLFCAPEAGRATKPPVLLIHGAFSGAWMWSQALQEFAAAGHPTAALSLRGHGRSTGHDVLDWLSIDDYADDVKSVCDSLGCTSSQPPILIGHSMGGFIAQKYLERHRALGLGLVCSVPPQGLLASQFYLMFSKPGLFIQLNQILEGKVSNPQVVRDTLFAGEISDDVVADFLNHTQKESQRAIWDMSMFNMMRLGVREIPPVIVIGAEKDALIQPFLVHATARSYGVQATVYPECGHALTHEKAWPDVSAQLIRWASTLSTQ